MVLSPQEEADDPSSCGSSDGQKLPKGHEVGRLSRLCMALYSSMGGEEKDQFAVELTKLASQRETLGSDPIVSLPTCYSMPLGPGQVDVSYGTDPNFQVDLSACANICHFVEYPSIEEEEVGHSTFMMHNLDGGCLPCAVQSDDADTRRPSATTSRGQGSQVVLACAQRPTGMLSPDDVGAQKPLISTVQEGLCPTSTGTDLTFMMPELDGGCLPCAVQSDDADTRRPSATTSRGQGSQVAFACAQRPTGLLSHDDVGAQKPLISTVQEGLCPTSTGTDLTFMMPELDGGCLPCAVQSDDADTRRPSATTSRGQGSQVALACAQSPTGLLSHDDVGAQKPLLSTVHESLCRTSTGTDLTHPETVSSFHRSKTEIVHGRARRNGYLIQCPGTVKLIADRASRGVRSNGGGADAPGLSSRPASQGIWHATYQRFCLKEAEDRKKRQE
eukprot:gene4254-14367_t